jgi:hypothetical protein
MSDEAPDPFGPLALDMGSHAVVLMFNALRNNGASRLDAALLTGMQIVLNSILTNPENPLSQ